MPAWAVFRNMSAFAMTYTPPANAMSEAPVTRLSQADAIATSEDEQAVSIETQGPCRFRKYETRAARIEVAPPVKPNAPICSAREGRWKSAKAQPTKPPT